MREILHWKDHDDRFLFGYELGFVNAVEDALANAVNEDFYAFVYGAPPGGMSPFEHYINVGWREGRDPNPWFSTRAYLEAHPDVADAGLIPLVHFLQTGAREGRLAAPSEHARRYHLRSFATPGDRHRHPAADVPPADAEIARQWRSTRHEFDYQYYAEVNDDVTAAGIDPLVHYLTEGWKEGRDPSAFFSTRDYLEANPDVAEAGVNPFYHYLVTGKSEGRLLRMDAGVRYKVIANIRPIKDRIAACPRLPTSRISTQDVLARELSGLSRSSFKRLLVTVSHDDFTVNIGGLQFCLRREADALEREGVDHIHLFPADPLLVTNREDQNPAVGVLINGKTAGYFRGSAIAAALETFLNKNDWSQRTFAIHSVLGHNAASLAFILRSARMKNGFFWLHDYASVCAGLNLLRNDVEYCHAPASGSSACELCVYGDRRDVQLEDHAELFESFSITVIAPSQAAVSVWRTATQFPPAQKIVHAHCQMVPRRSTDNKVHNGRPGEQMRVAFLGYPGTHKGWPIYRDLALKFSRDRRYAFYHLGRFPERGLPIAFRDIAVDGSSKNAMIDAIEDLGIDVAIIWSLWPETFCFTAHEAIAGGAFLLAPPCSGNVPHLIRQSGKGLVVPDETELERLFASGDVRSIVRQNRPREFFSLEYSNMTADLIFPQ